MTELIRDAVWLNLSSSCYLSVEDTKTLLRGECKRILSNESSTKNYSKTIEKALDFYIKHRSFLDNESFVND